MRVAALDGGGVMLEVADDGAGWIRRGAREALAEGHIGLASVAQRVEANGRRVQARTRNRGRARRVRVSLPPAGVIGG